MAGQLDTDSHGLARLKPLVIAALALACACSPRAAEPQIEARAEQVWSGHAFEIETADGGRESVVLAGVSAPNGELYPAAMDAARQALTARLEAGGASVGLTAVAEPERDRYDRLIATAETLDGDLAEALVRGGHLMVWPRAGESLDFTALYTAEAAARAENSGAWSSGAFSVLGPDPNALSQRLDGPVIVEGRVVDTGEARDRRVFVNFGLDWRSDFTATADRRSREVFSEAGIDLMALEGAQIRVRGWLYETNGPAVSLTHPAQLEIVDAPQARTLR
ncbi:thermonuclease family protein [Maricaulaceae bacterium MS644]